MVSIRSKAFLTALAVCFVLSTLTAASAAKKDNAAGKAADRKKIVFIAGPRSHGYGNHEHKAGCLLFEKALKESGLPVETVVNLNGWPKDQSVFDGVATIVIYSNGGARHPMQQHLEELEAMMKEGVGLVCIHYAVEATKGPSGDLLRDSTGGTFETHWSVNPHWTAEFRELPEHPVTHGVKPFSINDEWYYHMRFKPDFAGVTPILSDLPPEESLSRKDGAHSGNPEVRKAVLKRKEPQHTAWAIEREDGGRGFGFTGGHVHWNWGNDNFRKLMLNAIVWTAGLDVPSNGVKSKTPTIDELMENQDYPVPGNFNKKRWEAMIMQWNAANR